MISSKLARQVGGLVYSESKEGGYCKYCVLFATCEGSVKELGVLVNQPLTNFKKLQKFYWIISMQKGESPI